MGALDLYRDKAGPLSPDQEAGALLAAPRQPSHCFISTRRLRTRSTTTTRLGPDRLRCRTAGMVTVQAGVSIPDALAICERALLTRPRGPSFP